MKAIFLTAIMLLSASAEEFEIYLLAGQSNMDGRGQAADLSESQRAPSKNAIIYYRNPPHSSDAWKPLEPGYSIAPKYKGKLPSPTFGPEIGFAACHPQSATQQETRPYQRLQRRLQLTG